MEKQGVFYAVSVGPGDPELLTRQACRVLTDCGVVAAPRMKSGRMLALDIAAGAVDMQGKTILPLDFTMARDAAVREDSYRTAAAAIETALAAGQDVAMVNLGDVSVYATAYYILERIRSDGFKTVMCSGVTSFCAVAARLGRSLTRMEEPLHILPGSADLDSALALPGTKVIMKSGKAIHETAAALERRGMAANAGMVADCGLETEQVYTDLRQLPEELADALPPADTVTEADYRSLVTLLAESRRAIRTQEEQRYGDMVDYYTMWAHQIKTPIASMRLTLQNEDSGLARSLSGDLMRVEQYVEMVLVFLRLDSSTTDYVIRAHSLDDIVRPAVRKFAGEFIRRRLRLDYQPLDRTVFTDAKWLGFVVEQVLSNALKYTASGSVTIAMDGDDLCIRDTGMGIAPEDLPRIFDRGFTGLNGRRDTRASGIGLYLCRRICRSLGHTIRASSVPNQGTEIRIGLGQKKTLPE